MTATTTTTYEVRGLTCEHCVGAVSGEVAALRPVRQVAVDLATGRLTVESDEPLDEVALRAAVEEAGYDLAPG